MGERLCDRLLHLFSLFFIISKVFLVPTNPTLFDENVKPPCDGKKPGCNGKKTKRRQKKKKPQRCNSQPERH
jgi:hypothetical protein